MTDYLPMLAAVLGFIACEILNILPAIKDDENSPSKFSFRYYLSRPKNQLTTILNACGTGILFIGKDEVIGLASRIPFVSEWLGEGTPMLVCGLIGFCGAYVVRLVAKKLAPAANE